MSDGLVFVIGKVVSDSFDDGYEKGYEQALLDMEERARDYREMQGDGWRHASIGIKVAARTLRQQIETRSFV